MEVQYFRVQWNQHHLVLIYRAVIYTMRLQWSKLDCIWIQQRKRTSIHKQKPTKSRYFSYIIHSYMLTRPLTYRCIASATAAWSFQGNQTDYLIDTFGGTTMRILIGLRAWVMDGQQSKGYITHQLLPMQLSTHQWRQVRIRAIMDSWSVSRTRGRYLFFTSSNRHQIRYNT